MALREASTMGLNILCIGGANLDRKLKAHDALQAASSNPCTSTESPGGVARNVADNLARLGLQVQFASAMGCDAAADVLLQGLQALGVDTHLCARSAHGNTGSYTAVLDTQGQLILGMADMALIDTLTPARLQEAGFVAAASQADLWMADMNLPAATLTWLAALADEHRKPLVVLAVSDPKMNRLPTSLRGVDTLVLNQGELRALCAQRAWPLLVDPLTANAVMDVFAPMHNEGLRALVVTCGEAGVLCLEAGDAQAAQIQANRPADIQVVDVSGAGDSFCAGLCASVLRYPDDPLTAHARRAMRLPLLTVQSAHTVSSAITPELI